MSLFINAARNAKSRFSESADKEIAIDILENLNDFLHATQSSYKASVLLKLLSFYMLNSCDSIENKEIIAKDVNDIVGVIDALNVHSDTLTLLYCVTDTELNK